MQTPLSFCAGQFQGNDIAHVHRLAIRAASREFTKKLENDTMLQSELVRLKKE